MASSIFPLATTHPDPGFVSGVTVTAGGSGFTSVPLVTFEGSNTTQATAIAVLDSGVTSVTVTDGGTGFIGTPPTVGFSGGSPTSVATAVAVIDGHVTGLILTDGGNNYQEPRISITGGNGSGATAVVTSTVFGTINIITLTNPGTGYTSAPTVTIHERFPLFGNGSGATATSSITRLVSAVNITFQGTGYTSAPTVTLSGGDGSGATATSAISNYVSSVAIINPGAGYASNPLVVFTGGGDGSGAAATASIALSLPANSDLLEPSLAITNDLVKPGGGGIMRLSFSFSFDVTPASVKVFNNGILKGTLNADNSNNLITDGYYRFDIDVEAGDNINLQSTESISLIHFIRTHLVQFGA